MLYAGMGKKQETISWLERAYEERNGRLANLAVHPQFAFLRGESRYEKLLERMNVPANLRHPRAH
jgi:N-acetylglutamate synthase-like GNAT family acetyltransferase